MNETSVKPSSMNLSVVRVLSIMSLVFAAILLISNLPLISPRDHAYISSLPLAFAGFGYAVLQIRLRPARGILLKRLFLSGTFVIWAVDQLLPAGRVSILIGDFVVAAYVLDLYWIVQEQSTVNAPVEDRFRKIG
jgi:hypothetical protein